MSYLQLQVNYFFTLPSAHSIMKGLRGVEKWQKKIGLICEGGGTKAAYTCGVLQCFLDYDIEFPYTVGISAGAEVLLPFVAKQKDRSTCHRSGCGM